MRRVLLILLLVLVAPAGAMAADPVFNDQQRADLRRISDYLNSMRSLTGRFLQIGPDGTPVEGTFYLKKPNRLRFEYDKPSPLLVIADGYALVVQNLALRTTDRYPLIGSPLRVLLADDVDLNDDSHIVGVRREAGALLLTAQQESGPAQGQITISFADSGGVLELRQWEVIDAQGMRTVVVVNGIRAGLELQPDLFVVRNLHAAPRRLRR